MGMYEDKILNLSYDVAFIGPVSQDTGVSERQVLNLKNLRNTLETHLAAIREVILTSKAVCLIIQINMR